MITCRPYIPATAAAKELNIHRFLNEINVFQVDVKSMLDFESKKDFTPSA